MAGDGRMDKSEMPGNDYSRLERQAREWLGGNDPRTLYWLGSGAKSTINVFEDVIHDRELARPLALLYLAEEMPEGHGKIKESAYLAAMLGFEGYKAHMGYTQRMKDGDVPPELEKYLGICQQLSDYCRSKVDYLPKGPEKIEE